MPADTTAETVTHTDPTNKYEVSPGPRCYACDGYHGAVNVGVLCLQLRVRRLERALALIEHEAPSLEGARALASIALTKGAL